VLCDYADMEITPKPGHQRQIDKTSNRNIVAMVLVLAGICVIVLSVVLRTEMPGVVMLGVVALGVVLIVLPAGYLVRALQQFDARERKDRALRQPGTVELLTVETSVERDEDLPDTVVLRSDLQIRLDSGDTISGPYLAYFKTDSPHAAKFHVAARLRCLVNPENAWKVRVPLDAPGRAFPAPDADLFGRAACFYSAT